METNQAFYLAFRERFPGFSTHIDREYFKYWGDNSEIDAYSWFHSLANAINREMQSNSRLKEITDAFVYIEKTFLNGSDEVKNCIDVSFVENLFWQVSPKKAEPYWLGLPASLKKLYVDFHGQPPL
jgi:hypothetical protein